MGKSYRNNKSYSENRERVSNTSYKQKKNRLKEERVNEEYMDYKIHGYKND